MPLDEATLRFAFLLRGELRRLSERGEEHAARGEELRFDSASRIATVETRRGETVARFYGEVLATYAPRDRILRWAWAGRAPSAETTHGDVVFREGQARGVPQLAMSVVGDLDARDASTLAGLGALVAGAHAVHERANESLDERELIGLFARPRPSGLDSSPENRFSVPPPPSLGERASEPPGALPRAYRSVPPVREIFQPRTGSSRPPPGPGEMPAPWSNLGAAGTSGAASQTPRSPPAASTPSPPRLVREPARAHFLPVANAALLALARASKGYQQGLLVVTLDGEARASAPRRMMVQLVLIDAAGTLRALDPPPELMEGALAMVEAERRAGNGTWRKVSARITPKADGGATLSVDVL